MPVRLHLDLDAPTSTGRLIGWNLGRGTLYGPEGHRWRTPLRVAAVEALARIRAPHVRPWMRFSGLQIDGSFGNDGYHFDRPGENVSPEQYLGLMQEADAEPIVTLNFATGTAEEAHRYALLVAPHGVTRFEIGNECYGIWNTGYSDDSAYAYAHAGSKDLAWRGRPSSNAEDFGARAEAYVDAVLAAVPEARFFVPLTQASMDAWGGVEASTSALAPLLSRDAVDAVVVHQYHVDEAMMFGLADKNDRAFIVAGSERYRREYERLRRALAPFDVGVAITEYQVAGAFARGQYRCGDDAISGLGIADMLIAYAQLGIEHACQHMSLGFTDAGDLDRDILVEPWYLPLTNDGAPRPSLRATSLIADALRPETIPMQIEGGATMTLTVGEETIAAPSLHAVGFRGDDTTVVVLNRGDATEVELPSALASARTFGADTNATEALSFEGRRVTLPRETVTALTLE